MLFPSFGSSSGSGQQRWELASWENEISEKQVPGGLGHRGIITTSDGSLGDAREEAQQIFGEKIKLISLKNSHV